MNLESGGGEMCGGKTKSRKLGKYSRSGKDAR